MYGYYYDNNMAGVIILLFFVGIICLVGGYFLGECHAHESFIRRPDCIRVCTGSDCVSTCPPTVEKYRN